MEHSAAIELAKHTLLVFAVVLAAGTFCAPVARLLRVPDVVAYLFAGLLLGPGAAGIVDIDSGSAVNQAILIFGASYILFDGGATIRLTVLRETWLTVALLGTVGVAVSTAVTGLAAYFLLGLPGTVAILLGATLAATDPAAVVPVFRQAKVKDRVAHTVIAESAFNDAMGAIATVAALNAVLGGGVSVLDAVAGLLRQSLLGVLVGAALGYLAAVLTAHQKFGYLSGHAPAATLMTVTGAYLSADGLHSSGFMAVFVFGLMLGNQERLGFKRGREEERVLREFVAATALLARMFIFVLLGAQVDFALLDRYLLAGGAVVAVFMLAARPLAVLICAGADRRAKWQRNELLLMCWTRETGVIPCALAGVLLGMKAPGADAIAAVTFIAVLATLLIQATTTRWLARKLGQSAP